MAAKLLLLSLLRCSKTKERKRWQQRCHRLLGYTATKKNEEGDDNIVAVAFYTRRRRRRWQQRCHRLLRYVAAKQKKKAMAPLLPSPSALEQKRRSNKTNKKNG
jgi:hypothetical protein